MPAEQSCEVVNGVGRELLTDAMTQLAVRSDAVMWVEIIVAALLGAWVILLMLMFLAMRASAIRLRFNWYCSCSSRTENIMCMKQLTATILWAHIIPLCTPTPTLDAGCCTSSPLSSLLPLWSLPSSSGATFVQCCRGQSTP